jgi:flagellar biosynthesis protein FlhF
MRIKKYTGSSMKEVLLEIKNDLGDGALILKTRKLPRKVFEFGSEGQIEVTAALDDTGGGNIQSVTPLKISKTGVYSRPVKPAPEMPVYPSKKPEPSLSAEIQAGGDRFRLLDIKEDIREVKELLKSILQTGETTAAGGFAGGWAVLYKRLVDAEINPEEASDLVRGIKNDCETPDTDIEKKFVSVMGARFPVAGPLKHKSSGPMVVAFTGPTGSGKTTTLAKLAAHCCLEKKLKVSIVTADTYRIAAIEQIRIFAEILGIGLHVIFSAKDAEEVLETCKNDHIVFVDTAGRSQKNTAHMREIEELLAVLKPDETHLVLSAATKGSDLNDIIRRYNNCKINRLLFTKLDETSTLGNIFTVVSRSGIPVSYFTTGQSVPDDIELAQPGRFVKRLWEGSRV